ncbi:hypothetical protein Zmor_023411 [Zophobas morio]|uniref:Uncharacterized protein n=1 Tax=Zophobas morio TaxID=2755281 RepID=A0AA38HWU5_9CUCU|nr:hypothetical protein Zmor_023411 [Zophobas morio]
MGLIIHPRPCKTKSGEYWLSNNAKNVIISSPNDICATWQNVIDRVPAVWNNYVKHIDKIINHAWENEKFLDTSEQNEIIFNFNNPDDSESGSEDDNSSFEDLDVDML